MSQTCEEKIDIFNTRVEKAVNLTKEHVKVIDRNKSTEEIVGSDKIGDRAHVEKVTGYNPIYISQLKQYNHLRDKGCNLSNTFKANFANTLSVFENKKDIWKHGVDDVVDIHMAMARDLNRK